MFKVAIRNPHNYETRFYYPTRFEIKPDPWHPDRMQVILYGTAKMSDNFPHRKDAGEIVATSSYVTVETLGSETES